MPDLKRLISHFTYRIEGRPDGSFIAHATDPSLPPLEAPTRLELQQKIQQNITAALQTEFPALKLPAGNQQLKMSFHLERTPDGSFNIHSNDPNAPPTAAAPHEIESKFAEKLIGYMGKHVLSNVSPELASQLTSGDIKVFVSRNGLGNATDLLTSSEALSKLTIDPNAGAMPTGGTSSASGQQSFSRLFNASNVSGPGSISYSGDNSPIHRAQPNSGWGILRFLLTLLFLGAIAYFYFRFR